MRVRAATAGVALACCVLLAGCGGGGGHSTALPAAVATIGPGTTTPFAITVASASDVTKVGIASSAQTNSPEVDVPVSASAANCTTGASTRTCTANLTLPTGLQTLTITTYGSKIVHSQWRTTLSGARVTLAVGTSIAQISLDLAASQLAGGTSGATMLYVTARDANGNTIVGDFSGATIAVTSSDTTGSITLAPATITAGGTPVAVTYNGSGSVTSVTFAATSAGVAATAIVDATLSFTTSQLMYTASLNTILVFAAGSTGDTPPLQRITVPGYTYTDGAQPDGHGNIWTMLSLVPVTNGNATIYGGVPGSVPATANGVATASVLGGLPAQTVTAGIAIDGAGSLYVLQQDLTYAYTIYVFGVGQSTPSRTITSSVLSTASQCGGLDVASGGTIAVKCADPSQQSNIYVFAAGANGSATPVRTIAGASTTFHSVTNYNVGYVVWGNDGSLVSSDYDSSLNTAILVFAPGANGNVAPTRRIAGAGTGLDALSLHVQGSGYGSSYGIGIDGAGSIYVGEYGSQSLVTGQILTFAPTATGAALPSAVLGGPLTVLGTAYAPIHFGPGVVAPASATTSSVTGDFLSPVPNRGWNYTMSPAVLPGATPPPTATLSLYANPTPVNGDTELVAYEVPGVQTTALNAPGTVLAAEALFAQGSGGGWGGEGYIPISSGTSLGGIIPIPGAIGLTRGTFALGQTFDPYLGLTATVIAVGTVPGSSACPGGSIPGAIVAYTFAQTTETIGYVPGCGITYFLSDNGSTAILTSVGTYSSVPTSSVRAPASLETIRSLRTLWQSVFTPWRPR